MNPSGLEIFHHLSGSPEKNSILESTSGGVCVLDYDNDGWMDLYLVNGGHTDILDGRRPPVQSRLFRNTGRGGFEDVTATTGVSNEPGWGHGCAAADYDEDGWVDLYVTNYGANRLYHNEGNGMFTDVAPRVGLADPRWSTGAAWADFDQDEDLDLFVANYLELTRNHLPVSLRSDGEVDPRFCQYRGRPVFCGPRGLRGASNALFRNDEGSFRDVSAEAGVEEPLPSYSFGVVWSDFDADGNPDLFVANDSAPNYLYRNRGNGTFEEIGYLSGTALSESGSAQANMGVAVGDYNGDGLPDIFVTHFSNDYNTLYRNLGGGLFTDVSFAAGVGEPSIPYLGWGAFFFDFDNDRDSDLFVANGHVYPQVDTWSSGTTYLQAKQLFENVGTGFREATAPAGEALLEQQCSRGAAYVDYDNDGWLDVAVNNLDGEPLLLRNEFPRGNHYLQLRLMMRKRDAIGARAALRVGERWQYAEVQAGSSYLSQNDPRLHFGLGTSDRADELRIHWPNGDVTVHGSLDAGQIILEWQNPTTQKNPSSMRISRIRRGTGVFPNRNHRGINRLATHPRD